MGKRIEMDLQEKEYLIRECLSGRMRMREAARRAGVGHSTMHNWIVFLKGTAPHNTWRLYKRPRLAYAIELTGEERGKIKGKEWIFPSPFSANSRQSPERPPAAVFIRTSGPGAAPLVDELNDLPDLLTALQ